jgi:hypothetical protein
MSNRTYYRGPDAVVTDRLFVWRTTSTQGFVIRELQNVRRVQAEIERPRTYTAHVVGGALFLAAASWTLLNYRAAYLLVLLAIAIPAVVAATWRTRPRRWEMRATYRGRRVVLYASADSRVFNQVTRALRRSVEDARPASTPYDLLAS